MSSFFFVFPSVWETRSLRQKYNSWETRAKEQQFVLFSSVRDPFHVENLRRALTFPIWLCFLFISDTSQEFPSGVEWNGKEWVWGGGENIGEGPWKPAWTVKLPDIQAKITIVD